ncbi:TPA: serine hydrolase, partial [Elizabethkingia meningoseptica]
EGRILEEKNLEVMKPVIGKETYGRGLMNFNFHGINFYGNTGGTYGTNTILVYEPKSKISISLIINGEQYERDLFIKDVVDIIFNNHLSIHKS